jgi:hypothetical protein
VLKVEDFFRTTKSILGTRPIYHPAGMTFGALLCAHATHFPALAISSQIVLPRATAIRVDAAVQHLGYRPNALATLIARGRLWGRPFFCHSAVIGSPKAQS